MIQQNSYWRYALQLESTELVKRIFRNIHKRDLNNARAKQVVAAFLQCKEYYRNAARADTSVKPLLLFYSVSSFSRCLTLLLKKDGGEETLKGGHGLSSVGWNQVLTNDIDSSLKNICNLSVQSCKGLFQDLLKATENKSYLHIYSGGVDSHTIYDIPTLPITLSFSDVVARIPDVIDEYSLWTQKSPLTAGVIDIKSVNGQKSIIRVRKQDNIEEIIDYAEGRIRSSEDATCITLNNIENNDLPIFINSFIEKSFGTIPNLYIAKPFQQNTFISQIPQTFILSYFLGMLCRYFPSHWMALSRGSIGDEAWPLVQTSIYYIEEAFPQLVVEFLEQESK